MMKKDLTIEDSPFYIDYGLPTKNQSFKASEHFEVALKRHLQDKYADEIKKDGKFRYGRYIRKTLEDYLQNQCLERKMFGKSIFAIVDEDKLRTDDDLFINPLFVTNPSEYYVAKNFNLYSLLYFQVHKVPILEFEHDLMMWKPKQEHIFLKELKKQLDEDSSANLQVLEVQVNNYLDFYHDGIFSDNLDPGFHIGANIIPTKNGAFGLWYSWFVDNDYSINVNKMQVLSQETLLNILYQCGNKQIYDAYETYFRNHNKNFPQLEIDVLKKQLQTKLHQKKDLDDEIADLQKEIENLEDH